MAIATATVNDWASADAYLGAKHDRPIANNTRVQRRGDDAIAIMLHATDVVTFYRDGRVRLANGGWDSVTTADRIRTFAPAGVVVTDWRYVHRLEAPGYHRPTNDAERAQAIDGQAGRRGNLDVTFNPADVPAIVPMDRALRVRQAGPGRAQGEVILSGWWDGPRVYYTATREGSYWILYASTDPDTAGEVIGKVPTLKAAKAIAWSDAVGRGYLG